MQIPASSCCLRMMVVTIPSVAGSAAMNRAISFSEAPLLTSASAARPERLFWP